MREVRLQDIKIGFQIEDSELKWVAVIYTNNVKGFYFKQFIYNSKIIQSGSFAMPGWSPQEIIDNIKKGYWKIPKKRTDFDMLEILYA